MLGGVTLPHKTAPFKSRISGMIFTLNGRSHDVKKSKYTEQQIAFALKQAELGTPVEEVCRKMGISDATFYIYGLLPNAS